MGETDLRRGARWLGVAAAALGLAAASALAAPPDVDFTITPNPPNQGDPTVFQCDRCLPSDDVAWDLSGNGNFERTGQSTTITFANIDTRTMRMRVIRDGDTAVITKSVTVNGRPTGVSFDFTPSNPVAGQEIGFTSEASDPENDPITFTWTFGDNSTPVTGPAPAHAYAAAGTYTVGLTATDSHGASRTATSQVKVDPDPGPTASFEFSPTVPDTGETVTFTSDSQTSHGSITKLDWDFDEDGVFDDLSGSPAQWAFASPGVHTVRLRVEQTNGGSDVAQASVRVNGVPTADFTWNPANPVAGRSVDLVSTSSDFEGPLETLSWDLNGDGLFGDGSQAVVRQPFPDPGTYNIGLRVTDSDGAVSTVRKQVVVAAPPRSEAPAPGGGAPSGGTNQVTPTPRLRFMSPFPVVRIAGTVLPRGARINVLSVRAPRGSRITVRCKGKGCPVGTMATTSATRLVRLRKFERRLRAGIRLKLFVRQANRIGKYTSFLIRAGAPPKRVDLCLFPSRRSPGRCP